MKTAHQQRIEEFMRKIPQAIPDAPCIPSEEVRLLRAKLIMEEALETVYSLGFSVYHEHEFDGLYQGGVYFDPNIKPNLEQIADGCADLSVVTIGTLSACGIHDKALLEEVDHNNLDKFQGDAHKDESGKWIKSSAHKPPDIVRVLENQPASSVIYDSRLERANKSKDERLQRAQDDGVNYNVETREDKEKRFKKLHDIDDCTCTIMDFDWPNPTINGFGKDCPYHFLQRVDNAETEG